MITDETTTIDFEDLESMYGTSKAEELFESYRTNHTPEITLTHDFAIQVVRELPDGFAEVEPAGTMWRLYNPDSDSYLEWAECHRLILPNGCHANIEVLDYTYYVDVEDAEGEVHELENCDGWEQIAGVIQEFYDNIQEGATP
jgi:hypothetical protein